jgi:anti-sigma B factor antagonist
MAIDITLHETSGSVRVVVAGEVDLVTGHELERALSRAEERSRSIVLDLSAVEFFDSTGLQILLDADHRARAGGHTLSVVAGDGEAARVLELTRVATRLSSTVIE